jgi:TPR repeat protein
MRLLSLASVFRNVLLLCLFIPLSVLAQAVQPSALELLLQNKNYAEFLPAAQQASQSGGAEATDALFLLGKAYHLGWGVEEDIQQAKTYYQQAAARGSARASHNLGTIALDRGRRGEAISYFEAALEKGLKEPTLYNLGRAHDLTSGNMMMGTPSEQAALMKAADYYEAAYRLSPRDALIGDIVRVRTSAYRIVKTEADHRELMKWVDLGVEKNVATVFQNYGAMLYYNGDEEAARPWFEKADALGISAASYALGLLAKKEGQADGSGAELAFGYFLKAAQRGNSEGLHEVSRILDDRLASAATRDALEAVIDQTRELRPAAEKVGVAWPPFHYREAEKRLSRMRIITANQTRSGPLPAGTISFRICFTDIPGRGGLPLPHKSVRVVVLDDPQTEPLMLANGKRYLTDQKGCLRSTLGHSQWFRQQLAARKTLAMIMNSRTQLLYLKDEKDGLQLLPFPDDQ